MRPHYLICVILIALTFSSCLKTSPLIHVSSKDFFVSAVRRYFTDSVQLTNGDPADYPGWIGRTLLWDREVYVQATAAEVILVPVRYNAPLFIRSTSCGDRLFHLNDLTHLLVYRQAGGAFQTEMLMSIPDSTYLLNPMGTFMGQFFVSDWLGNPLDKYLYTGGEVQKYEPSAVQSASITSFCSVVYGYNYSLGDPGRGYAWSQPGTCYYSYYPDQTGDIHVQLRSGLGYAENQ